MSTAPGVSFVVTVYNKAPFLPLVIDALFAQTGDFEREFIIIDDGSSDGSWELLQGLTAGRSNVTLLRQANAGPAVATNVAVRAATLPWLKIVDADDVLAPRCTEILRDAAMRRGLRLAVARRGVSYRLGCPIDYGDGDLPCVTVRRQGFFAACLTNVPCNLSATLIDRALYWEVGGCDERIFTQDYSLLLRVSWRSDAAEVDGVGLMASPVEAPGRVSGNQRKMLHDTNLAIMLFLGETPGIAWRHRRKAIERACGRAWKWQHRKLGVGFWSRWFWFYAAAKFGPPGLAMPLLPLTLAAFVEPPASQGAVGMTG